MAKTMKILMIDDHALFREGMSHVLRDLVEKPEICEAGNAVDGMRIAATVEDVDMVLLDLHMPEMDGFATLQQLRARHPDLAVVVLSASENYQDAKWALDNGAVGYIPKSATSQVMVGALRLILSGGIYLPPLLLNQFQTPPSGTYGPSGRQPATVIPNDFGGSETLTARQRDVLRLLAVGKSNKEIARDLGMAEGTVKIHITAIFRALSVVNRTQAVLAAKKMGLVDA